MIVIWVLATVSVKSGCSTPQSHNLHSWLSCQLPQKVIGKTAGSQVSGVSLPHAHILSRCLHCTNDSHIPAYPPKLPLLLMYPPQASLFHLLHPHHTFLTPSPTLTTPLHTTPCLSCTSSCPSPSGSSHLLPAVLPGRLLVLSPSCQLPHWHQGSRQKAAWD